MVIILFVVVFFCLDETLITYPLKFVFENEIRNIVRLPCPIETEMEEEKNRVYQRDGSFEDL